MATKAANSVIFFIGFSFSVRGFSRAAARKKATRKGDLRLDFLRCRVATFLAGLVCDTNSNTNCHRDAKAYPVTEVSFCTAASRNSAAKALIAPVVVRVALRKKRLAFGKQCRASQL